MALAAFNIFGAASDTKMRTIWYFNPSGNNVSMTLSNAFEMAK